MFIWVYVGEEVKDEWVNAAQLGGVFEDRVRVRLALFLVSRRAAQGQ